MGEIICDLESIALVVCGTDTEQGNALLDMAEKHPEVFFTPIDVRSSLRAVDQSQVKARKFVHARNGDCVQNQLAMLAFGESFVACVRKLAMKIVESLPTRKIWVICCSTGEVRSDCLAKALVTRVFNGVEDDERIFNANIFSTSGVDRDGIEATVVKDAMSWAIAPWLTRRDDRKWGHDAEVASQLAFNTLRDLDTVGRHIHHVVARERKLGRHRPTALALLPTPPPAPPPPALVAAAKREAAAAAENAQVDTKEEQQEEVGTLMPEQEDDYDEDPSDAIVGESLKRFHRGEASSSVDEPKRQRRQSVEKSVCPFCQGTGRDEGDKPTKVDTVEGWAHILEQHAGLDDRALAEWKILYVCPDGHDLGKTEALFIAHSLLKRDAYIKNPSAFVMTHTKIAWEKIRPNYPHDRAEREAASRPTPAPIGRGVADDNRQGGAIGRR